MKRILPIAAIVLLAAGLALDGVYLASLRADAPLAARFHDSDESKRVGCDFFALYLAAQNAMAGRSVYAEPHDEREALPCHQPYRYLPLGVVVGAPLALLPPGVAYWVWIVVLQLLLLVNLLAFRRLRPTPLVFGFGALVLLGAPALYLELYMGQFSLLQATFVFLGLVALEVRPRRFGWAWLGSLCWKYTTWICALPLLLHRQYRVLAGAAILLVATSLPHFLVHTESMRVFGLNFSVEPEHGMTHGNLGLLMLVDLLLDTGDRWPMLALPALVIALSAAVTLVARRAPLADQLVLWLPTYFLCYKHVWEHHYVMLTPVLLFLAARHRSPLLLIPGLLLMIPTPYTQALARGFDPPWLYLHHGMRPAAAILLWCFAAWVLLRPRSWGGRPRR